MGPVMRASRSLIPQVQVRNMASERATAAGMKALNKALADRHQQGLFTRELCDRTRLWIEGMNAASLNHTSLLAQELAHMADQGMKKVVQPAEPALRKHPLGELAIVCIRSLNHAVHAVKEAVVAADKEDNG